MLKTINKKRSSLVLLSIIAPISILIGFRLSGVLQGGPIVFDTIAVDPVMYDFERPTYAVDICGDVRNQYNDSSASVSSKVQVFSYYEKDPFFDGNDCLSFNITATAKVTKGFISSVMVRLSHPSDISILYTVASFEDFDWIWPNNVKVTSIHNSWVGESFVEAIGIDRPRNCSLGFHALWELWDHPYRAPNATISVEFLCFNETAYRKYVMPINMKIHNDVGNTIKDASEITDGTYRGHIGQNDQSDFYKIWAEQNRYVDVMIYPRNYPVSNITTDLYLYDPAGDQRAASTNPNAGALEAISFKADTTGWWYIEVRYALGPDDDLYVLVVYTNGLLGDINDDGWVDIKDASLIGIAWNSKIGDWDYDPYCDLNLDGAINIKDVTILGCNWQKHV